jgi:cytochrome b6-f complex iron-sulfur subunit
MIKGKNSEDKGRRDFLNLLLGGGFFAWLIALFYPIYNYLEPPEAEDVKVSQMDIGNVDAMEKDSGKIIKFGNKPVLVLRRANGEYAAFGAICTHLDCIVQYRQDYGQIYCACHNGRYDLNGKNVSGPPPAPLPRYGVSIKGENVIIFEETS